MTTETGADRLDELVSLERGEIDRRIFSDEDIFEQELELIFGRAWQFLCHESQIPKTGDFFETPIGRDNVLSVRQKDGSVKALLNTCSHRGNAVCRAEEGNTKAFMCTYHGWSYDLAGNLIGVPDIDLFYKGDLDNRASSSMTSVKPAVDDGRPSTPAHRKQRAPGSRGRNRPGQCRGRSSGSAR